MKPPRRGPLALRLSPVERAVLEPAAARIGVPLSTYIKAASLACTKALALRGDRATSVSPDVGADELAALMLASVLGQSVPAGRGPGLYPCGGHDCCWRSITAGMVPENVDHIRPCPLAKAYCGHPDFRGGACVECGMRR